jgi:hypothetical membrane protein
MNMFNKTPSSAFGWVGIIAVAAFCIMWLACYAADGTWVWGYNSITDFGISNTAAADYFSYGLVIAGAFLALYGVGRLQTCNGKPGYAAGGCLLALTGIAIIVIGLLTKDVHSADYHNFFAILAGVFLSASVLAIAIQQYYCGKVLPVGVALVIVLAVIVFAYEFNFAKFEVYAIVAALIWVAMDAALMVKSGISGGAQ